MKWFKNLFKRDVPKGVAWIWYAGFGTAELMWVCEYHKGAAVKRMTIPSNAQPRPMSSCAICDWAYSDQAGTW